MYTMTYGQLMPEFNASQEVATIGLSTFIWGLGTSFEMGLINLDHIC